MPQVSTSDIPEDLIIPGLNLHDALEIDQKASNSIFHITSNPDLRVAMSMVKVIIGSACSQVSEVKDCPQSDRYLHYSILD